jgi:hypothetical protein
MCYNNYSKGEIKMKVWVIKEEWSVMGEQAEEVVAICQTHERAIDWLIENKGLNENYSYYILGDYTSLKEQYQKYWKRAIIQNQWKYFHLDGLDYSIEEFEVF